MTGPATLLDFKAQPGQGELHPSSVQSGGGMVRRLAVLLPAREFRVAAAASSPPPLNLFERFALKCCQGGVRDAAAVTEHSGLHPDLSAFWTRVLADLLGHGLVSRKGDVTERGAAALSGLDWREAPPLDVGYVYQIADGSLLRGFVRPDQREDAAASRKPASGVEWIGPLRLPDVSPDLRWPTAAEVARTVRRNVGRASEGGGGGADGQREELPPEPTAVIVDFVDERPRPVLLRTLAYAPASALTRDDFLVCDPLRPRADNLRLYRAVRKQGHSDLPDLTRRLTERAVADNAPPEDGPTLERANHDLNARFGRSLHAHPHLQRYLLYALAEIYEARRVEAFGSSGGTVSSPWVVLKSVEQASLNVARSIEAVFALLEERRPYGGVPAPNSTSDNKSDRAFNEALLTRALEDSGFQPRAQRLFPQWMPDWVRKLPSHGRLKSNPPLTLLVVAAVLRAGRDPDHPLRKAARGRPHLLLDLDEAKKNRNPTSHHNPAALSLRLDEIERDLESILDLVEHALDAPAE